jgi:Xaa-Pro dipeptidase
MEAAMGETSMKLCLLRDLAARNGVDAILLQRVSSIAWVTGGAAAYVNIASSKAEYVLLVTAKEQYLISNNIEAPRLEKEEQLQVQGWNFQLSPWFETEKAVQYLTKGLKLGMDHYFPGAVDLSGEIARLRANLNLEEGNRFRMLGQLCARLNMRSLASWQKKRNAAEYRRRLISSRRMNAFLTSAIHSPPRRNSIIMS